jgi:hypothetical protein
LDKRALCQPTTECVGSPANSTIHAPQNSNAKSRQYHVGEIMSFLLDIPTVSVVIASVSVIGSAVYYMMETRHQRRIRQTESIIRLSPWFSMNAKDIQEAIANVCSAEYADYEDYLAKYTGKPEQRALKLLGNYFEGVGLLVSRKLVEVDLVFDFWGDIAESVWDDNEQVINGMRKDSGTQYTFEYWEFLVRDFKKRKNSLSKKKRAS